MNVTTLRRRGSTVAATLSLTLLAACGGADAGSSGSSGATGADGEALSGTVSIDGSSTVAPLSTAAAELFQAENSGVQVTVGTSGTGGGFEKFCAGETDISDASRAIEDDEIAACEAAGITYDEFQVANDALTVVVSPDNDWLDCITVEQLAAIWGPDSTLKNWNEVDPSFPDVPLELFGPGTDSGTFDYFTGEINGEEGASRTDYSATEDDNVTVQGVSGSEGGMGYFGFSYFEENADNLKALQIDGGGGCVEPSLETVQDGSYTPLARPLFIYPSATALDRPEVLAFVQYYVENSASIAEQSLFIPLTDEQQTTLQGQLEELAGS